MLILYCYALDTRSMNKANRRIALISDYLLQKSNRWCPKALRECSLLFRSSLEGRFPLRKGFFFCISPIARA